MTKGYWLLTIREIGKEPVIKTISSDESPVKFLTIERELGKHISILWSCEISKLEYDLFNGTKKYI